MHLSQSQRRLLRWQQVESFLALHALLLIRVVWRESGWMCGHCWVVIAIMKLCAEKIRSLDWTYLESIDAFALGVQVVSQIH